MRRLPSAGPGLALILLAGCSSPPTAPIDSPFGTQAGGPAVQVSQVPAAPALPLRGTCNLAFEPGEFVSPGVIRQIDEGTCRISHLGRSTMVSDKLINVMTATQTAEVTITSASGDMLHASGSGTNTMAAPGHVAFRVELTIEGGTGRFSGASGVIVSEGTANLNNATAQLTMTGTISY
jgi:hypothetical protein